MLSLLKKDDTYLSRRILIWMNLQGKLSLKISGMHIVILLKA